jgi:ribosomal-protein-serine acetyltransferase
MPSIMTKFPLPIVTERLLLRKPIEGYTTDALEYVEAVTESIQELRPWLAWAQFVPTVYQAEEYIRDCCANWITKNNNNIGLSLWIIEKSTNIFVGHIVMWNIDWYIPKIELGFWMRTSQIGKGYITEATNALTQYCFLQLGVNRLEIRCEIKNEHAQTVPKKLNYHLDGILPNGTKAVHNGALTDVVVFSKINLQGLPELKVSWT